MKRSPLPPRRTPLAQPDTEGTYSALLARLDGLSERDHNRLLGRLVVMAPAVLNEAIDRVVGS